MANLCIIPARGGSKRIPGKNKKDFLGKPIISYSIEAALNSKLFDEVMVSTDDNKIAEIAKNLGAKIPFLRSNKNADDHATTVDVLLEVLERYSNDLQKEFSSLCCIYPTAPLIQIKDLSEGYSMLTEQNLDSVFPIVPFNYPVYRGLKRNKEGLAAFVWPENEEARSQDLEEVYHDVGQWYWMNVAAIKKNKSIFSNKTGTILLDELGAQDIDVPVDWKIAELKYSLLNNA